MAVLQKRRPKRTGVNVVGLTCPKKASARMAEQAWAVAGRADACEKAGKPSKQKARRDLSTDGSWFLRSTCITSKAKQESGRAWAGGVRDIFEIVRRVPSFAISTVQ